MVDRIKQATKAVKAIVNKIANIVGEHHIRQTITVDVWYPDHPPRTVSPTFAKTRKALIESGLTPCWICGSTEDLEAHHFHVEWAFADAVDWELMKSIHPEYNWVDFKDAEDFVDSPYNMVILCEKHHRHKNHGIHNLPYPIWIMQRHQRKDFILFSPNEEPDVGDPNFKD